jgi:hypothetical protein
MKKIYFYPGRFQPMGPHHAEVFFKIMLDHDDENLGPFIVTSDKTELPKSPLNFDEKKQVMMAHGISNDRIIKVKNPYYAKEILFDYDPSEVEAIYLVGAKDMAEDPRFKKTEGTTKEGYKWSIEVAPHIEKDIKGEEMSGTTLRKTLANADEETFYSIMGFQDKKIYDLLTQKFSQIEELYNKPQSGQQPYSDTTRYKDHWKSSNPEPKKPVEPAYKFKRRNFPFRSMYEENLQEQQGGRTLRVYDFDDTLAVTRGANIKVKHEDGSIDTLDPAEFAVYKEQPGDKFDFTEFDSVIKEATPIQHIVDMLRQDVEDPSIDKVTILTARLLAYPVKRYIREDLGLDVYVVAVGSSDPLDKATWIEDHILKGYNDIIFIDDSEPNRKAVEALIDTHPDVNLNVYHPSDLSEMMYGMMNRSEKRRHKKTLKKIRTGLKKYNKKNRYFKIPKSWRGSLTRKSKTKKRKKRKLKENKYYLDNSNIQGIGAFADNDYPPGTIIGKLHDIPNGIKSGHNYNFYELGKSYNHSDTPNCENLLHNNTRYLVTIQPIQKGEELTADYRLQPELEQPEHFLNENALTKGWWKNIINEMLLKEGGAAGHMTHPFNLPDVNSGKDLKDIFNKSAESLQNNPGSVKIDGVNSSIRLIDLDGTKQFVMDRGSKKELDVKGITKDDLLSRFGDGHGMVKIGGEVLDMFNKALPSIKGDLEKLGAYDDPNILFNMEYVSGKTNVQDYGSNFIAIHGLNKIETKEVQGKRKTLTKRVSSEVSYDKSALQSLLDNLTPIAKEQGFEVYGSVPTEMTKKPNFSSALSQNYTIVSNEGEKTQTLDAWLNELNDIPEEDFIFMNVDNSRKKIGAVSKLVYTTLLDGGNIDELFENEEDKKKAIEGFTTYLATEKLGDEVLKVLDSPMGSVDNHEGVVIRDENIAKVPFKITGKFILGGMTSDF